MKRKRYFEVLYNRTIQVRDHTEGVNAIKSGALALVVPQRRPKYLKFLCPCGCARIVTIILAPSANRAWRYELDCDNRISLWPSVRLSTGCRSHFVLLKNTAHIIAGRQNDASTLF
jgi:hypothetical protein